MKSWVTAKFDYTDQGYNEQFSEYFDPKQILSLLLQCHGDNVQNIDVPVKPVITRYCLYVILK